MEEEGCLGIILAVEDIVCIFESQSTKQKVEKGRHRKRKNTSG